jgi:hypothetical protein
MSIDIDIDIDIDKDKPIISDLKPQHTYQTSGARACMTKKKEAC